MRYLGLVRHENGNLQVSDTFRQAAGQREYEAVQVGDSILLFCASPLLRATGSRAA